MYIDIRDTETDEIIETIEVLTANAGINEYNNGNTKLFISAFINNQRTFRLQTEFARNNNCGFNNQPYDFELLIRRLHVNNGVSYSITPPTCYGCESCGLMGYLQDNINYQFIKGNELGTLVSNPNAYVQNELGYSWRYNDVCISPETGENVGENKEPYIPPDPLDGLEENVCDNDPTLKGLIETQCAKLVGEDFAACCETNPTECDEIEHNCIFDGCAVKTEDTEDVVAIEDAVNEFGQDNFDMECQILENNGAIPELTSTSPTKAPITTTTTTAAGTTGSPTKAPVPATTTTTTTTSNYGGISCTNPGRVDDVRRLLTKRRLFGASLNFGSMGSSGDPHFTTFKNYRYNFQGKGCYYYAGACPTKETLLPFSIRAQHRRCNSVARCIENIYVDIRKDGEIIETIDIKNDYVQDTEKIIVYENFGSLTLSPFANNRRTAKLNTLWAQGKGCVVDDFFLTIASYKYNGGTFLNFRLDPPTCYKCEVCGLGGYLQDELQVTELLKRNGEITTSIQEFGDSWIWSSECVCTEDQIVPPVEEIPETPCDTTPSILQEVTTKCTELLQDTLGECCNKDIEKCQKLIDDCIFDTCAFKTDNPLTPIDEAVTNLAQPTAEFECIDGTPTKSPTKAPSGNTPAPISTTTKTPTLSTSSPITAPPIPTISPTSVTPAPTPATLAPTPTDIVTVVCQSIIGEIALTSIERQAAESIAVCPVNTKIVSCGTNLNQHSPGGTVIKNGNTCSAWNYYGSAELDQVQAVARCCNIPDEITVISRQSSGSTTKCLDDEILIGCSIQSSNNNIAGTYTGLGIDDTLNELKDTNNQCTSVSNDDRCVTTNAQCAKLLTTSYNLECKSITKLTSQPVSCPNGYFVSSCNGYTNPNDIIETLGDTTVLENYYISQGSECIARRDGQTELYVTAVCCQLTTNENVVPAKKVKLSPNVGKNGLNVNHAEKLLIISSIILNIVLLFAALYICKNSKYCTKKYSSYNKVVTFASGSESESANESSGLTKI